MITEERGDELMSNLSPEERRRIYEEEKARLEAQEKAKAELQARRASNFGIGCLVVILVFVTLVLWRSCEGGGGGIGGQRPEHDSLAAYIMSQEFVKDRLISPSTAKFPSYRDDFVTHLGDGRYLVKAYVDAENIFGAKIRNYYTVTLRYVGGNKWQLESIQIGP